MEGVDITAVVIQLTAEFGAESCHPVSAENSSYMVGPRETAAAHAILERPVDPDE